MTSYIVKKDNRMICGNCRMRLPRLILSCPFCESIFSNYEVVAAQLLHEYENGYLTFEEIHGIIDLENEERLNNDTDS